MVVVALAYIQAYNNITKMFCMSLLRRDALKEEQKKIRNHTGHYGLGRKFELQLSHWFSLFEMPVTGIF